MNRIINLIKLFAGLLILNLNSCVTFAPPSPMLTYGGPRTTIKGTSDAAIAVGTGAAMFQQGHSGGQGWFGRYKYGLSDKCDFGIDAIGLTHSNLSTFTTKIVARYQLLSHIRIEGGIGAADDSNGKSLNSDFGITFGTLRTEKAWNYYASLRIGYAKGYASNVIFQGKAPTNDTIAPPDATITLLNIGAQGKINDKINFIFEGGYGYIFPYEHKAGMTFYLSCGLLFNIGKKE